jgi:hypothetical protein
MKKLLLTLLALPLLCQVSVAQTATARETAMISGFSSSQGYTVVEISREVLRGMSDRLGSIASQLERISIATTESASNIESMKSQVADLLYSSNLGYSIILSDSDGEREVRVAMRRLNGVNNNSYLIFSSEPAQGVLVLVVGSVDINSLTGLATQFGVTPR